MKKFFSVVLVLLALVSLSFAQFVNDGIRTRTRWLPIVFAPTDTVVSLVDGSDSLYAIDSTGVADFDLGGIAEQGFSTLVVLPDSADSINAWFSSGCNINYFGFNGTTWTTEVQCVFDKRFVAKTPTKPINIAFLQSEALVDTSDRETGYMPADKFRVKVSKLDAGIDTVSVSVAHPTFHTYLFSDVIVKVWFK